MEAAVVGFVEKQDQLAGILLVFLADQQSIDEDGCIREFLAITAIDSQHDGMEARQLAEHFFLGEVVADVVTD